MRTLHATLPAELCLDDNLGNVLCFRISGPASISNIAPVEDDFANFVE